MRKRDQVTRQDPFSWAPRIVSRLYTLSGVVLHIFDFERNIAQAEE